MILIVALLIGMVTYYLVHKPIDQDKFIKKEEDSDPNLTQEIVDFSD